MTALTLTLRAAPADDIDVSRLSPDHLRGRTPDDIRAMTVDIVGGGLRFGELFDVAGDDADHIHVQGACARLLRIGAAMTTGSITVEGDAGPYAGAGMRGGALTIEGSAGAFLATGMRDGHVEVRGDAGPCAGAAIAGERAGMRGGVVVIRGNAGERAGERMRRGQLLIAGDAGDFCGARMWAGTIIVLGRTGSEPGLRMRRGSLLVRRNAAVPPTFNDSGTHALGVLRLLGKSLRDAGDGLATFAPPGDRVRRYVGDRACDGLGEILVFE